MLRPFLLIATATTALLVAQAPGADPPGKAIKVGEPFKGELTDKSGRSGPYYWTEIPVTLKFGQDVTVRCDAPGPKRTVFLVLIDPTGRTLEQSGYATESVTLTVPRVNVDGVYKVKVTASLIGPFDLDVTATPDDELDERALKEKLQRLQLEVKRTEAKLKAIQEKKKKP